MSLPPPCWKAQPCAGSCSPLPRSSWWRWKSRPCPCAGVLGERRVPEPGSAPAAGLGAEASPLLLLSLQPLSLVGKEQVVCRWCGSCRPRASAPRCLPPPRHRSRCLAPGPASHGKRGGGWHLPSSRTLPAHPRCRGGVEGALPWGLPSCSPPQVARGWGTRGEGEGQRPRGGGWVHLNCPPAPFCSPQLLPSLVESQNPSGSRGGSHRPPASSLAAPLPQFPSLAGGSGLSPVRGQLGPWQRPRGGAAAGEAPPAGAHPFPKCRDPLSQGCSGEVG